MSELNLVPAICVLTSSRCVFKKPKSLHRVIVEPYQSIPLALPEICVIRIASDFTVRYQRVYL